MPSSASNSPFEEAGEYEVTVAVDGESTTLTHTFENEDGCTATTVAPMTAPSRSARGPVAGHRSP